jgi:hypothetical protein
VVQQVSVSLEARRVAHRLRAARINRRRARTAARAPDEVWSGGDPQRLVPSPVFVLSSVRSGSTLVRTILNSHSQICAPHELHLGDLDVSISTPNAKAAVTALGLDQVDLENLLWDRVLHLVLAGSGKSIIVDKTPQNVFQWKRLNRFWPDARYIFLLRHPARVAESMVSAWPKTEARAHYAKVVRYAAAIERARESLPGFELRYEDFVRYPAASTQQLCAWLGVPWEEGMLRYGEHDHGPFRGRLGDWSKTIRSGVIRPPQPDPDPASIPALGYA